MRRTKEESADKVLRHGNGKEETVLTRHTEVLLQIVGCVRFALFVVFGVDGIQTRLGWKRKG